MRFQRIRAYLIVLLPLLLATAGCDAFSNKEVGMVVLYEVEPDGLPPGAKPSDMDLQKATAAIERRLNGGRLGSVHQLNAGWLEVSIFRTDPKKMQRIADMLPRPGTLEFRIMANKLDHKALIDRATAKPDGKELHDDGGELLAWWVPVHEGADPEFSEDTDLATRTRKEGDRKVLQALVVKDPFDVSGEYLTQAAASVDENDKPCVTLLFNSNGGKLLGGLTASNLPDEAQGFTRRLGVILDGELHLAPRIRGKISNRAEITRNFTAEEVQECADLLNAGSLPVPIRKMEQRMVKPEK